MRVEKKKIGGGGREWRMIQRVWYHKKWLKGCRIGCKKIRGYLSQGKIPSQQFQGSSGLRGGSEERKGGEGRKNKTA